MYLKVPCGTNLVIGGAATWLSRVKPKLPCLAPCLAAPAFRKTCNPRITRTAADDATNLIFGPSAKLPPCSRTLQQSNVNRDVAMGEKFMDLSGICTFRLFSLCKRV